MAFDEVQQWAVGFLDERAARPSPLLLESLAVGGPETGFSPFLVEDAERAREASRELMRAADAAGGGDAGLTAAQARAEELLGEQDRSLVRFALKLFMTHHADGKRLQIPALEQRAPLKVLPSEPPRRLPDPGEEASGSQEALLNWWREDPEANEHHDHWHAVYPTVGIADPTPADPEHSRLQDRQGELFFYMHQQMLARYDHERLAIGLPKVAPLDRHGDPIPEGYDPAAGLKGLPEDVWLDDETPTPRPDGATMPASVTLGPAQPPLPRTRLDQWHQWLLDGASQGQLLNPSGQAFSAGIDDLGHATEPSFALGQTVDQGKAPDRARYGNFHGFGHVFLSLAAGSPAGVMVDTDTAIRDPVFFRWHRHVDDIGFEWQQQQAAHDLEQHAADVQLRRGAQADPARPAESPDLILVPDDETLGDAAFRTAIAAAVGGANAGTDFASTAPGSYELQTEMLLRELDIQPPIPGVPEVEIPYLDQRPFAYAVRLENTRANDAAHDVTVRLFMVADALFDDRRMWIELDKFRHRVEGEHSVAVRRARESAVIRKPASKPPGPTVHSPGSPAGADPFDEESYCDCGWPYNLLLPRGTGAGLSCWLVAIVTDWEQDKVAASACGSMSFCGAKDRYPDLRPMGYPFDRPISGQQLATALSTLPAMAARSFSIRWLNPEFPD